MSDSGLNFGDMLDEIVKHKSDNDIALIHGARQFMQEHSATIEGLLSGKPGA